MQNWAHMNYVLYLLNSCNVCGFLIRVPKEEWKSTLWLADHSCCNNCRCSSSHVLRHSNHLCIDCSHLIQCFGGWVTTDESLKAVMSKKLLKEIRAIHSHYVGQCIHGKESILITWLDTHKASIWVGTVGTCPTPYQYSENTKLSLYQ